MKKLLKITSIIIIIFTSWLLVSANFYGVEKDLSKIDIFPTSNGDGFTAFDLRWHDMGIISYERQCTDENVIHFIGLYWNGINIFATFGGIEEGKRISLNVSEELKNFGFGEYVFIVFVVYRDTPGVLGFESKSEKYIYGETEENIIDEHKRDNDPFNSISLTVEVRSEGQAVIMLKDTRLNDIVKNKIDDPNYSVIYALEFGDSIKYYLNTFSVLNRPGEFDSSFTIGNPWYDDNCIYINSWVPQIKALRTHSPLNKIDFSYFVALPFNFEIADNCLIWEISMPLVESIDFTKINQYHVTFVQMHNGIHSSDDEFERTFYKEEVLDTRNLGQVYDIEKLHTDLWSHPELYEKVLGMTSEQVEMLYFTLPESNYVYWQGEFRHDVPIDDRGNTKYIEFKMFEIVTFDDNGVITGNRNKIVLNNPDTNDIAFNSIIDFIGNYAKMKIFNVNSNEVILYTRSGNDEYNNNTYTSYLDIKNVRHIDDYLEKMSDYDFHLYKLTDVLERNGG